jgi:hypothetical protein
MFPRKNIQHLGLIVRDFITTIVLCDLSQFSYYYGHLYLQ